MTDINTILFSRQGAEKKLATINALTTEEVLRTSAATVARIAKEVGEKGTSEWNKGEFSMWVGGDDFSNEWNAWVRQIVAKRGKAQIHVYFQYDNTDTTLICKAEDFLGRGEWAGKASGMDECRRGYREYHCVFPEREKAKAIRGLLREYVLRKYADKLQKN